MKKWDLLEQARAPDGSVVGLYRKDGDYAIRVDGRELMSTRRFASEERLAEVACAHVRSKRGARALIGGLGLGFTLRAALRSLGADAEVVVAELLPPVVAWNRNTAYGLASEAVADTRTRIELGDVGALIERSAGGFDAIMLDADNNTTAMNTEGNRRLYQQDGLARVHAALRPGGCVVYWSADADPRLAKLMGKSGFAVEEQRARAHATGAGTHALIIGRKRS
jgi:spermidine synthase